MRVQGSTSVAANSSSGNVLSGKIIEITRRRGVARFFCTGSAAGLKATISSGPELLMQESDVSQANRFPIDPDDKVVTDVVMPNDRLSMDFRNTTAGALTAYWAVDVSEV